ncbi:hypothetical protein G4B88_012959 [Cannabis sativa]|uniref:SAM domain-containing protein n=1 Tax=Cannabis sativa TaxID=3483 RepID=A0A7J6FI14_CANSA|nr:hypothetical protein G4B88_012959 [Cannabis sativa]
MYADREDAENRRSIKDRLNGSFRDDSNRRRQFTGKRQRQDDKWEHDLYEDSEAQVSNRQIDSRDLRLKLQRKNQQASVSGRGSHSGVRDLREKLSGSMHPQPVNYDPHKPSLEAAKPTRRSVAIAVAPENRKASTSVDDFLHSLGLEKYSITFQAEEVDMAALTHMTDEDLKAIGIPMLEESYYVNIPLAYAGFWLFPVLLSGPKKEDTSSIGIERMTFRSDQLSDSFFTFFVSSKTLVVLIKLALRS